MHVPFCRQLCPYCDFAVAVRREIPHQQYADAVIEELETRAVDLAGRDVRTAYFGGGTPALLDRGSLARITEQVAQLAGPLDEVTIEANPLDVTEDAVRGWRDAGFTRLSLGVQSFDADYLLALGRDHDGRLAERALEAACSVGLDVSMDLIYGGPHHSESVLLGDLEVVARYLPGHVSSYQLTVEEGTVFGRRAREGKLLLPDEDATADISDLVIEGLAGLGFERYEVSSYARPGHRAQHNSAYWTGAEYLGVGMGAHSLRIDGAVVRRANTRRLAEYLRAPSAEFTEENVSALDHFRERLFLAVRMRIGVPVADLEFQFEAAIGGVAERIAMGFEPLRAAGLVEVATDILRPTARGLDVSDWLAERIWDSPAFS